MNRSVQPAVRRSTATLLTPAGRGAIAAIRVEGPNVSELVGQLFQPANGRSLATQPLGRILFGRWGSASGEELVVCRRADDLVDVHCHGGDAAVATILSSLQQAGCQVVDWRQATEIAAGDPIEAQALEALATASTERAAWILLDQQRGALRIALNQICGLLAASNSQAALGDLERLLARWRLGRHLTEPWRVVLAGPPNVGKSSLINALVGYERAIVYDRPGTTRDVVTASSAVDGWPVEFADTAGLRASDDPLESEGIRRSHEQMSQADLVLLVFDRTLTWTANDEALLTQWPGALVVHCKADLARSTSAKPVGLLTSAVTGLGIAALVAAIAERLVPDPLPDGAAVPFTMGQAQALQRAQVLLAAGDALQALEKLRSLTDFGAQAASEAAKTV
jgi:tRNA modification GTPase